MFEIKFKINGKEVYRSDIEDALISAALQEIKKDVHQKLSEVRCSEHNQLLQVSISESSPEELCFLMKSCCKRLIDEAANILK